MIFLRALVITCVVVTVPTTAVAGAISAGCRMEGQPTQTSNEHSDHSMHAGHVMAEAPAAEQASHLQIEKATPGCKCGCNCSASHCTSSASGLLFAAPIGGVAFAAIDLGPLSVSPQQLSAAHHLDILRPPTWA